MKKQFQSKSVPRGTRTIWRYLGALFILFTFAIGNVWAADDIYYVAMVQNVVEDGTLSGTSGTLKVVKYTASTKKYAVTDAVSWNLSSPSVGCKGSGVSKCSDISDYSKWNQGSGSQKAKGPKFSGTTTLSLGALTATKITFIGYRTNNSAGGTLQIGTEDAKTTVKKPSSTFGSDCVIEYTGSFTGDVSVVASHEHTGVFVITVPATAPTNYTVTINPNGGAYASTPDGWTASAGVFTKSVASGTSFTPPAGLTKGTDDLSWKDGDNKPVTYPTTISGNVTYVAQWAPHSASSDATLSALSVAGCTFNETFDPATLAYTVDLPFYASMPTASAVTATKNDANASDPVVSISGNVISVEVTPESGTAGKKTYTITVNIADAPTASSSINIEQLVLDNSKAYNIGAALETAHIGYTNKNDLDSLSTAAERNEPYLGLKFKSSSSTITIIVPANETLKVKFGARKTTVKVAINDGAVSDASISNNIYSLAAASAVRKVKFSVTENNKTIVLKQIMVGEDIKSVQLPWLVTYDAGEHGTCATAKEVWWGTALTLPTATPEDGWSFNGWKDDENNAATSPYTPTKDVVLTAQYTALASPFDLTALTYKIGTADAVNVGYEDGTFTYNIELPYANYDAITVAPTLKESTSYLKGDEVLTVSSLPGAATFTVVAAGGSSEQLYTVNFSTAPKDGVCIVKADLAAGSSAASITATSGAYKDADNIAINVAKDLKLGSTGDYVKVAVKDTYFQDGDVVEIVLRTDKSASAWLQIFADEGTTLVAEMKSGVSNDTPNHLTISGVPENISALYLYRTEAADGDMNPYPTSMAVYRAMNPVLTAITINGRDGEIDALDDKHFTVTIPNDANLASLTVVPTIVRNAAHATTPEAVISNEGAWVLTADGDNTYRIMDKDGDYTDYTITLVRDVLKHTVRFMDGTSEFASALVVDGESPVAPATDPTKEDYLFQGWAETVDGDVITDWSAISISAAKDFYAKWVSDGAIKLIEAGAINTTNFVTGGTLSSGTVSVDEVDYKYITLAGTNGEIGSASNVTTDRFVMYHATTTKTKIQIHAYANGNARQVRLSGLVEGASTLGLQQTINVAKNDDELTEYFSFDSDKHRTFYITIPSSADDVYLLQVKVIESGEPLAAIGTAGTSFNFNKGRLFAPQSVATSFDGIDIKTYNKYAALSTEYAELSAGAISFYVPNDVCLSVASNANGTNKYYVTNEVTGTDNETTTANAEFNLTGGKTWYIRLADSSKRVRFTNIAFTAPKCEKPTITAMVNVEYCEGDVFAPMVVSASVGDGGSLHYAWFKEAGETDEAVGTDNASFTPLTDGEYYVIVTNQLADHSDNSETSNTITVEHFASAQITTAPADVLKHSGLDVTLSVAATGKNISYEWFACDDAEGNNPVAFAPAQTGTSLLLENIEAGVKYYKVLVSSDCGTASAVAKVEGFDDLPLQDVTGNMTWDFSKANDGTAAGSNLCNEAVLVNVSGINNNDDFKSAYLKATANKFKNGKLQASMIKFHTTVDGMITVVFSNTGGKDTERYLTVNGRKTDKGSKTETAVTYTGFVYAGDVELGVVEGDGNMLNFTSVAFKATVDYPRTVVNPSYLGTLCWTNNAILGGATLYEFAGKDEYNKLVFDEVPENRLEAGKPYIFMPENGNTEIKLYNTDDAEPLTTNQAHVNHMYGTIVATDLYPTTDVNMYYFSSNHIWAVKDFTVEKITVPAYYCYVDYPAVLAGDPAPAAAPGRRRVTMGVQGEQVVTDIDNLNVGEQPVKMIIDGKLYILRGEKMYDATGRLVK